MAGGSNSNAALASRSRQRSRTRAALLSAGQSLFAVRPIDSVTIDEIVETADVAKGSFYNHFDDKDALANAVQDLVRSDVEFQIITTNQQVTDPPIRIARALCTVIRYAKEHPERVQALISVASRDAGLGSPLNAGLAADIRHGIEIGRIDPSSIETGVLIVIGLTNVSVQHALSINTEIVRPLASAMGSAVLLALGIERKEAAEIGRSAADDIFHADG